LDKSGSGNPSRHPVQKATSGPVIGGCRNVASCSAR
jgi:hypothetical protein